MVKSENKIPGVIIIARMLQREGVPKMGSESSAFVESSPGRVLGLQQSPFVGWIDVMWATTGYIDQYLLSRQGHVQGHRGRWLARGPSH